MQIFFIRFRRCVAAAAIVLALIPTSSAGADSWRAAVAKVNITPPEFMPMAGYGSRGAEHANGKLTDLWAKALVLEDNTGHRAVLVTMDLIGVDRGLSTSICQQLQKQHHLKRHQIALNSSHTHTGPVVAKNLRPMHYMLLNDEDRTRVDQYAARLEKQIVAVVGQAIDNLVPARVVWGSGTATFATNRRNNPAAQVPNLRATNKLRGPFDHDVPVLAVRDEKSKLVAVVFGYACHCTVLSIFKWSGDYSGFAQIEVEKRHPGCIAMFWAGCGGDQNPLPRRKVELAREYGQQLGKEVSKLLTKKDELHPIQGKLTTSYREIDLPLATLPSRDELKGQLSSKNKYVAARAQHLLRQIDNDQPLSQTYPYPIGIWHVGATVDMVFLGGEVVVDYALLLKNKFGDEKFARKDVWVAGYSNDVMAYIPSRRVLREGGYEGGGAMVYYGLPTVWAPEVEKVIIDEVQRQFGKK